MNPLRLLLSAFVLSVAFGFLVPDSPAQGPGPGRGQGRGMGMPEAERENIHGLFDAHEKITRKVKVTDRGYISTTTSEDPKVAKILRNHIEQMKKRLDSGLRVRHWDPAFAEYVAHYKDIEITIKPLENGVRVTAKGKTDDAIGVARNHAQIISGFVENGRDEARSEHPAALAKKPEADPAKADGKEQP